MHLSEAQRLPITRSFSTMPGSMAEPTSHLEMEPSSKGVGRGGRVENAATLGPNQQTGNRKRLAWLNRKGKGGCHNTQGGLLAYGGASWTLLREVIAPMGVSTPSPTTNQKGEKGALSSGGQRDNDPINTFGLRVPGKGTHWHKQGQPALICQTGAGHHSPCKYACKPTQPCSHLYRHTRSSATHDTARD